MRKRAVGLMVVGVVLLGGAGAVGAATLHGQEPVRQTTSELTGLIRVADPGGRTDDHQCSPAPGPSGS